MSDADGGKIEYADPGRVIVLGRTLYAIRLRFCDQKWREHWVPRACFSTKSERALTQSDEADHVQIRKWWVDREL